MFYSEILRIIEAGLDRDKDKVKNYALLLSKKLADDGDLKSSKRIDSLLAKKNNGSAMTDALVAPPVDQESRMGIVDIDYCPAQPEIILSPAIQARLIDFENTIKIKDKLDNMGMPFNMSLLLYGPPGCGKTSIAYYLAHRLGLPLVTARLDALISSLLGNTAKNLRRVFDFANRQPCVLFLDEFDAIAFGCPCMGAEQLEEDEFEPMFTACESKLSGKKIALFGSYGWGDGEWMRNWDETCRNDGAVMACDFVICNDAPDDDAKAACEELGKALA